MRGALPALALVLGIAVTPVDAAGDGPQPRSGTIAVAAGVEVRHARWDPPAPPRATVVMLPGRTEPIEKYRAIAGDFLARGFVVFMLDWRGQGLSTRTPGTGQAQHVDDYADYQADLDAVLDRVVAPAGTPDGWLLFGHSMGGHVALRHLARGDPRVRAAVLSAPMTDIHVGDLPRPLAEGAAWTAARAGLARRYAPGQEDHDAAEPFAGNRLSGDERRWRAALDLWAKDPRLVVGGVTFGWLDATFRSIAALRAPGVPERIRQPVLMLIAPEDRIVVAASQRALAARMPDAEVVALDGSGHEPFFERDAIRDGAWTAVDRFLGRTRF
jgi:lysophospholipase